MATIRESYGLDVPDRETLVRLDALFLAWHALRFWSHLTHRQGDPEWIADVRHWIERGAARYPKATSSSRLAPSVQG